MNARFLLKNAVNLLIRRELEFTFDRIPMRARNISNRKRRNLFRVGLNRLLPITPTMGYPYMAHISPGGSCNLHCTLCPVTDPGLKGKNLLPFDTFRKFIDETGDYLLYIILWSWGEPFLNRDIFRMIRYARDRNILTVTSSNMNVFSQEHAEATLASGLDALIVALDGTTQETYGRLRAGGDIEKVIAHTRMLVEAKRRAGATTPLINLRMVVSKENETEVDEFRTLAKRLGVDMVSFKAFSTRQAGYSDIEVDRRFAPQTRKYRWYRYRPDFSLDRRPRRYRCKFPWTKPTLFPDGTIIACEYDYRYEHPFGNITTQSFEEIWFGPRARAFRKQFRRDRDSILFCRDCVFDHKLIEGCVLEWELLEHA
ncbi:MAG: SPASM domain-containing protein [Candidatus Aminicenantales bacterium]